MARNLTDTPFAISRLYVWAVGITLVLSTLGIVVMSVIGRQIPPQLQSLAMFSLGAFTSRIEKFK